MNLKVFNNFTIYVKNFISKTSKQNLQIWNDAYHNWSRVETTSALKTPIGGISEIKGINLVPPDLRLQCAVQQQDGERHPPHQGWQETRQNTHKTLLAAGLTGMLSFNLFGRKEEGEDDPKDKLIMTIKRSILCIQREQYDKAEQMLHLALRMAQDLQSKEGVTYIFDVMANLAMEREQFKKAEKLFADVMQRLFADGHNEESPQVLHISSKLAHMAQLQGDLEKAYSGFTWTLERIGKSIKNVPEDKELLELYGLTKNWFGQLLMKQFKYNDAKKYFEEAYACLTDIYGPVNEAAVTILNNLSVACVNLEDFTGAKEYLSKAIDIVKELKDSAQEGILHANMGLIYLREGLMSQAKEECAYAYRIGKKHKNDNAVEQAEYCLNEVRGSL